TGKLISKNAADTVKKVTLELGGKSPMIILDDFDIEIAVKIAVANIMYNCGQMCTAASRTLVPKDKVDKFAELAKKRLERYPVGDPLEPKSTRGPLISSNRSERAKTRMPKGTAAGRTLGAADGE